MFRLLYKIQDQLTAHRPGSKTLAQLLANEVLDRVMLIHNLSTATNLKADVLDLKEAERYFKEQSNPSIKKFKMVIQEYYRKYTAQLKRQEATPEDLNSQLKNFLRSSTCEDSTEFMLLYWISEYLQLPKEVKKDYIEAIL